MSVISTIARCNIALTVCFAVVCAADTLPSTASHTAVLDQYLQSLPPSTQDALTPAQRQQWLDRVTWGDNDNDDAELQKLGWRKWLLHQLQPATNAPLPREAQQQIAQLSISQQSIQEISDDLIAQRAAIRQAENDVDTKASLQKTYFSRLNQLNVDTQKRFIIRSLYSPSQLREQMTWFWMNHFNVSTRKSDIRAWVGDYEENAIRPNALGNFRELLEATLRHPAMLRYLDNANNNAGRINENYARELLELHTMGVGSGYTQKDVQEMARVLTGVGITTQPLDAPPPKLRVELQKDYRRQNYFEFNPARHDYGSKVFLGQPTQARGFAEVQEALDRIVASPATAQFIARKLAIFFIADQPPQALVQRTAQAFTQSGGDIAVTLASLLTAPEAQKFGQKFRDPVHFVLASTRLTVNQRVATNVTPVMGWINRLGQNLYAHETPDGYPQQQSDWSSSGQMTSRFEVARQIAVNSAVLYRTDPKMPLEKPAYVTLSALSSVQRRLPTWSQRTKTILAQSNTAPDWNTMFLSAPEMMYR